MTDSIVITTQLAMVSEGSGEDRVFFYKIF